jgi:hypothetical protein
MSGPDETYVTVRSEAGVMSAETDHGAYDVLAVREIDGCVPGAATHAVYHESGALAGFASESGRTWDAEGELSPHVFGTLTGAVAAVADADRGPVGR